MALNSTSNTLHYNPRRKRMEGTYRGHKLQAGRGTAYQFQVGEKVYTAYWTGVLRYRAEPEFRQVETGQILSAEWASWFSPLAEVA